MKTETWYCWRELATVEGEDEPRLLVPWSNPNEYEQSFDFLFETQEEAHETREAYGAEDEDWLLVKMTLEVVDE